MESVAAAALLPHKPLQHRLCFLGRRPLKPNINTIKIHHPISKLAKLAKLALIVSAPPPPSFAAAAEEAGSSAKINLESLLLSVDDFFNRNPFFVSGVAFVWLVVLPLAQNYLSKCKFLSAIDAFRKLRDDPTSQLLDIRDGRSLCYLPSPNLRILGKTAAQVSFQEEEEEDDVFVGKVLERFKDPADTALCILDNFDGNSLRVAELLFNTAGFKEAYAIRGGLRGKDGWLEIQETLLPPSTHVVPRKNDKETRKVKVSREKLKETDENGNTHSSLSSSGTEEINNGYIGPPTSSSQPSGTSKRPLSPYPNYPDLRPPSSPTPSKPTN